MAEAEGVGSLARPHGPMHYLYLPYVWTLSLQYTLGEFIQPKHGQTTQEAVMCVLRQAGIPPANIVSFPICHSKILIPCSGTIHQNWACHSVQDDLGRHILVESWKVIDYIDY